MAALRAAVAKSAPRAYIICRAEFMIIPLPLSSLPLQTAFQGRRPAPRPRESKQHVMINFPQQLQLFGIGGSHHQTHIAVLIPLAGAIRYHLEDGNAAAVCHTVQRLEIAGTGIGGAAEDENSFIAVFYKWGDGIESHIRIYSCRIEIKIIEYRSGVSPGGVADISALGIAYDRDIFRNIIHGFLQSGKTLRAEGFIKGKVRFIGANKVGGSIYNRPVEFENALGIRKDIGSGQSDTYQRLLFLETALSNLSVKFNSILLQFLDIISRYMRASSKYEKSCKTD